jgi:hypothetical protein
MSPKIVVVEGDVCHADFVPHLTGGGAVVEKVIAVQKLHEGKPRVCNRSILIQIKVTA